MSPAPNRTGRVADASLAGEPPPNQSESNAARTSFAFTVGQGSPLSRFGGRERHGHE
jgi:hypothetical protein